MTTLGFSGSQNYMPRLVDCWVANRACQNRSRPVSFSADASGFWSYSTRVAQTFGAFGDPAHRVLIVVSPWWKRSMTTTGQLRALHAELKAKGIRTVCVDQPESLRWAAQYLDAKRCAWEMRNRIDAEGVREREACQAALRQSRGSAPYGCDYKSLAKRAEALRQRAKKTHAREAKLRRKERAAEGKRAARAKMREKWLDTMTFVED